MTCRNGDSSGKAMGRVADMTFNDKCLLFGQTQDNSGKWPTTEPRYRVPPNCRFEVHDVTKRLMEVRFILKCAKKPLNLGLSSFLPLIIFLDKLLDEKCQRLTMSYV